MKDLILQTEGERTGLGQVTTASMFCPPSTLDKWIFLLITQTTSGHEERGVGAGSVSVLGVAGCNRSVSVMQEMWDASANRRRFGGGRGGGRHMDGNEERRKEGMKGGGSAADVNSLSSPHWLQGC